MYSSDESFQRSQEGYFGVYFPSCQATREINTKITLERAQKPLLKPSAISSETEVPGAHRPIPIKHYSQHVFGAPIIYGIHVP